MLSGFSAQQSACRVVCRVSLRYHPSHATQRPSESLFTDPNPAILRTDDSYPTPYLRLQGPRSWTNPVGIPILNLQLSEEKIMATFISLINFTDQGLRNIKDSPEHYEAFQEMAEKLGLKVKCVYYTVGRYDMILIVEGSDETATAVLLKVGLLGDVRSQTLRGFSVEEMKRIISTIP